MKKAGLYILWLCLGYGVCLGQRVKLPETYLKDSFPALVVKARQVLASAYMVQDLVAVKYNLPGWEGFPVCLYFYKTGVDIRTGAPKNGLVYLLNPTAEKLAMWIATTCWITKKSLSSTYTDQLADWIMHQSGAQFPVGGVVYEDQYVKGAQEPYLFKDGVTVYMKDSANWSRNGILTDKQLQFTLKAGLSDLKTQTGQYARICSTTREDYTAAGGPLVVGSTSDRRLSWLVAVRQLYQQAWNSDINLLMVMWAKRHLK